MLGLRVQKFSLPKRGYQPDEYEDACAHDAAATRLALADGASDGFESRRWAQALVQAFIDAPPTPQREALLAWLDAPIQIWRQGIHWEQLSWYAEEKARRGAFATLLGVTFMWPEADCAEAVGTVAQWRAMAVGDACLFQVRGTDLIACFPVAHAADFGTTPALLSTRQDYNRRSLEALGTCAGECTAGDLFVLATNALAAWFLREVEAGEHSWQGLLELTDNTFAELVITWRQEGAMRNDDVTLVVGQVIEDTAEPQIDVD